MFTGVTFDNSLVNISICFFLRSWAGGILQILQSDWFRERAVFSPSGPLTTIASHFATIGKNCALCLVYRPRPRAQFFPIRTSRLVNNIYKLLVQHDTNKRLSAVKEKLLKWWRLSFFWAIFRKSLLRNSSLNHYILDTIFHNHKALSGFFEDLI